QRGTDHVARVLVLAEWLYDLHPHFPPGRPRRINRTEHQGKRRTTTDELEPGFIENPFDVIDISIDEMFHACSSTAVHEVFRKDEHPTGPQHRVRVGDSGLVFLVIDNVK